MCKFSKIAALAFMAMATSAGAQTTTATSQSQSASQSGVIVEGSTVPDNTPGLGGLAGSAGNCYPGGGAQAVWPGGGVGIGGGRIDPECNLRMEMAALGSIAGKKAAIAHACRYDRSMRATLASLGLCRIAPSSNDSVGGRASDVTARYASSERGVTKASKAPANVTPANAAPDGLLSCSSERIRISSRLDAIERQRAINWCKDQVAARR